jgi:predicted methyltransferase
MNWARGEGMTTMTKIAAFTAITAIFAITGCGRSPEPKVSIYEAAVASPARPDSDRERDASRKPAEVLEFIGVNEGMTVLDLFTGGGYYAELLSAVVGDQGKVVAQTNQAYINFVGAEFDERFSSGKLPNVAVLKAENNALFLEPGTYDVIMLVLSFHDLYHVDPENGWEQIDGIAFLDELRKGLKPGGIVAIIDHSAIAGAPPETGNTLHRIDPELVIANMEAAGFDLEAQSDLLRNREDDLSKSAFDPEVRGRTDRFVMRFRKPE